MAGAPSFPLRCRFPTKAGSGRLRADSQVSQASNVVWERQFPVVSLHYLTAGVGDEEELALRCRPGHGSNEPADSKTESLSLQAAEPDLGGKLSWRCPSQVGRSQRTSPGERRDHGAFRRSGRQVGSLRPGENKCCPLLLGREKTCRQATRSCELSVVGRARV